jgi:hypothetical protein
MATAAPTVRTFAAIGGFEAIARGVTLSVFPLTLYRVWGDAAVVSQIYFVVGLISLLTVLTVPVLMRHVPRRWLHSAGVVLYVCSAAFGLMGGKLIALALLCTAVGTAVAFVCYNANVLDYVSKQELGRLESLRLFYAGTGWSVGPFLGVWLLGLWQGAPFLLVGLAAILMLGSIWRMGMGSTRLEARIRGSSPNPLRYLPRFAAQPRLVGGWLLAVLRSCGWAVYLVYVGIFAIESGLSDQVGGLSASLASMGLFAAPLMLRWMQQRSLRSAVRTGFLWSGCAFVLASLCSPLPWISIALLLIGAYFLVLLDICGGLPFLMSVKPSERSEMSAVYSTFRDVANILTPGIVWLVLQVGPLAAVFATGGIGLLCAWLIAGRLHPLIGVPAGERARLRSGA